MDADPVIQAGVAGALLRELELDHEQFISSFARVMQSAIPSHAQLKYEGGFLSKKRLAGVSITLGDDTYTLLKPALGSLSATRTHMVRGIALKTEPIPVKDWLTEVAAGIEELLQGNVAARKALADALGLS